MTATTLPGRRPQHRLPVRGAGRPASSRGRDAPPRGARRWLAMAAVVLAVATALALLLAAGSANAHAVLVGADPADRSQLAEAPPEVTLTFNEPVELTSGGLRVFDADAERVDDGTATSISPTEIEASLPADLPDGGYVVVYRVISADSHPVAGVLSFTVGDAEEVSDDVVAELFGGSGRGVLGWIGPALRGLGYAATLLAVGALLFTLAVARSPDDVAVAYRWGVRAALAGVVLALLAIPVQAAAVTGVGLAGALTSPAVLGETVQSSFGLGSLVRATGLVWLAVLWRPTLPLVLPGIAGLVAVGSYVLDGHQRTVDPSWVMASGDVVHLLAAATWFGGLVLLVGAMRRRRLDDDPVGAATLVARFSSLALMSVVVVAMSGVAMAIPLVGSLGALTSTTYGRMLLVKVAAVAVVVVIGGYNRQRLVPAIAARAVPAGAGTDADADVEPPGTDPGVAEHATVSAGTDAGTAGVATDVPTDAPPGASTGVDPDDPGDRAARGEAAWRRLRSTMRVEASIIVAVLLLTGGLVSTQPAADEAGLGGYYQTTVALTDELDVDLVVDPNRAGRNTVHIYVLDPTGRPSTDVEDLVLELTYVPQGIGPIPVEPFFAGPGHWTANIDDLAFAGPWEIRVVAGLDRFTEVSTTLTVPVS